MSKAKGRRYYAVPDPDDPERMTYWYTTKRGLKPWPPKAEYGPRARWTHDDIPEDQDERIAWLDAVFAPVRRYRGAVEASVAADPVAAGQRFARFASRCCCCGRVLTDYLSKCYGIGPECRSGLPVEVLARYYAPAIGRAHAAAQQNGGAA